MAETHTAPVHAHEPHGVRRTAPFIISGLTSGHGVFHWFTQSFVVMLPEVRDAFLLSPLQVGAITSTRELVSGWISLPGGVVTDMVRRYWGFVLAGCMALFGLGWLLMGLSPIYPLLLVGMGLVAVASSVWHLPAMAALSHHFAHRRGSALSFHGIGGSIGDVAGPALTGVLLTVLTWRGILGIYAALPLFLTFLVFWAFRDIGRTEVHATPAPASEGRRLVTGRSLALWLASYVFIPIIAWVLIMVRLKRPALWGVTFAAGLRGMAFVSFITFLPLYLADQLGLSDLSRGLHIALLVLVGIVFTPIMGYLSDRYGRKLVLIPGLVWLCVFTVLLVPFGQGIVLAVIIGLLGAFMYSDQPILTAAALDIVGEDAAATTLGALSFPRFMMAAASPFIAGYLYDIEFGLTFYYVAGLLALATVILLFLPLRGAAEGGTVGHAEEHHGHHRGEAAP